MVFGYANKSSTVGGAASTAYLDEILKGVGKDFSQRMLQKIPGVTIEDVRAVIGKYFVPLFDSATSLGAVSVNAGKADEVEAGFKELGFDVERRELPTLGNEDESGSENGSESESGSEGEPMEDIRSP